MQKLNEININNEILIKAEKSFKNIRGDIKTGFFGNGRHDNECEVLFATVQSLGKKEYLNSKYFSKDYFDYIIIDEPVQTRLN